MNLLNFMTYFPDEVSCKQKWKEIRYKQGVICPKYGSTSHYWKSDKESYECKNCRYRQSLRANTIMHDSCLPFRYWFIAFHLVTSTKKTFSAKELQRQVGHKFYEPIWAIIHKIRAAMGNRYSQSNLSGIIELDKEFFSTEPPEKEKDKPLKQGRGSQKKTKVLVMAKSVHVKENDDKNSKGKPHKVNHIKMFEKSNTIKTVVKVISLCFCVCFALCGKAQIVNVQNIEIDTVEVPYNHLETEEPEKENALKKFWEQKFDSVCIAVQNSEKLSVPEKAKAIDGFFLTRCWSDYDINRDSLIEVALASLMMSPDIEKYNISEILTEENFSISYSKNNRLWNISWLSDCANNGFAVEGILFWQNKNNIVQGWSSDLGYDSIYKLRSKNDLYLLQNYWYITVVELTDTGIFKTGINIKIDDWRETYCLFDEKTQRLTFYVADGEEEQHIRKILKFNGKKFVTIKY